jgi:hypothetical protein
MGKGARTRTARSECQVDLTLPRPRVTPGEYVRAAAPDGDLWLLFEATPGQRQRVQDHAEQLLEEMDTDELEHDLRESVAEAREITREIDRSVARLRRRGASWAVIGRALGVSRQTAWERYRGDVEDDG